MVQDAARDVARDTGDHLTGSRIRERRLALGVKQGALAEAVGVSASYLNLIEHNHRKIGGKLLLALARALDVDVAVLTEGVDAGLSDLLDAAARGVGGIAGAVPPEMGRVDELVARFPGWTALIAAQEARARGLEAQIDGLRDRLAHDPALAEALHEVLSSVAAIRSTADILVRDDDLDPAWRGRFHRNMHEDAERLSVRAAGLLEQFDSPEAGADVAAPMETVEAMFETAGHAFADIELHGDAAIDGVLDQAVGMASGPARAMGHASLKAYAQDAARLPMKVFAPAALAAGFDPAALLGLGGGDVALVLRRMASLPPEIGAPERGLAICDGSGALLQRRRMAGFQIPRVAAGCPLWPLYRALGRVGEPETAVIEVPRGARVRAWAVAQHEGGAGFGASRQVRATMLVMPMEGEPLGEEVILAGPGCDTCLREGCPARR